MINFVKKKELIMRVAPLFVYFTLGCVLSVLPLSAGEIEEINSEINKIGAEMITLGGESRELQEDINSKFSSGKFDTQEMKILRKKILSRRIQLIKDSSDATREFRAIPEIAAKYEALEKSTSHDEAKKLLQEIDSDYKTGKFDTEAIKALKEKVEASERFIKENTAELRKMFDALPQFSDSIGKAKAVQEHLDSLAARRDSLLEKRKSIKP